jgi:hypothetical protein
MTDRQGFSPSIETVIEPEGDPTRRVDHNVHTVTIGQSLPIAIGRHSIVKSVVYVEKSTAADSR